MRTKTRNTIWPSRKQHSVAHAFASEIYSALQLNGSGVARQALGHLERGEFREIVELAVNPADYSDLDLFRDDYLACELMSKYPCWDTGVDREKVALEKFRLAEDACRDTNLRVKGANGLELTTTPVWSILFRARQKIGSLLGPFNWDQALTHCGYGPGATFRIPHAKGDTLYKIGFKPDVTYNCAVLAASLLYQDRKLLGAAAGYPLGWEGPMPSVELILSNHLDIVPGNRVVTVPKNAKTDRTIAIEPTLNGYFQKGIGGIIRKRLRKVGVDLNDQSLNQRLAKIGSLRGDLCTVDLKAASDSVSLELCRLLLPSDWYDALMLTRSAVGVLPSRDLITYEKVSSMGNGNTFELESLIFWAIVMGVKSHYPEQGDNRVGVYGDDLIFPTHLYSVCEEVLNWAGFTLNSSKSFCYGYFRESCGKHYFLGRDVSPFYVREDIDTIERMWWAANAVRRYARSPVYGLRHEFKRAYDVVLRALPSALRRPTLPDGYGDMGLIGDLDEVRPRRHECWDAWYYSKYTWINTSATPAVNGNAVVLKSLNRVTGDRVVIEAHRKKHGCEVGDEPSEHLDYKPMRRASSKALPADKVGRLGWRARPSTGLARQWPSYGPFM